MKRKKRKRVACLSSFYVYTRWYVYQQTFFFQNFPPQPPPPLKIFLIRACFTITEAPYSPCVTVFISTLHWEYFHSLFKESEVLYSGYWIVMCIRKLSSFFSMSNTYIWSTLIQCKFTKTYNVILYWYICNVQW